MLSFSLGGNVQPILHNTFRIHYEQGRSDYWSLPIILGSRKTWFLSICACGCKPEPNDNLQTSLNNRSKFYSLKICRCVLTADRPTKWGTTEMTRGPFVFFLPPFFFVLRLVVLQRLLRNPLWFSSVRSNEECTRLERVLECYRGSNMFPFSSLEPSLESRGPSQQRFLKQAHISKCYNLVCFSYCNVQNGKGMRRAL